MGLSNLTMLWNFLLVFHFVHADVIREDGYHNYEGQFTVKNKGRMLRVLMSFRNVKPEECALYCVRHLRCRTYNYQHEKKACELTDENFDALDADKITHGWHNYGTPKRVNGGWSNWRNYTECTETCGDGTLDQYRECDSPTPVHGGADCHGRMTRRVKCNIRGCPVNGNWSKWKNSTDCTKSCGSGTLKQRRDCNSPKPAYGGDNCTGIEERTVICNINDCPVNGNWSKWKNSTDCTKSCGSGTLKQRRDCNSPKPAYGGDNCTGIEERTVICNTNDCPVNGNWSKWKNSTDCTKSCGSGTLKQRRDCNSPKPAYGGDNCTGIEERTVICNINDCPVNGNWSKWKNSTDCTKSCGSGTLKQRRDCNSPKPAYGGDNCTGMEERTVICNTNDCPVVNLALRKVATQSSTWYDNALYLPSKAVDGNTKTKAITNFESNQWWVVDLGNVKVIKEIRLKAVLLGNWNKGLLVETRTKEAESWNNCNNIGDVRTPITKFQCHDKTTNVRFVRIRSTEKCYLAFSEVEIFGY